MKAIEVIEYIKKNYKDDDILAINIWNIDDISQLAKELGENLTYEDKTSILEIFEDELDCNYGLNWEGLKRTLYNYNKID